MDNSRGQNCHTFFLWITDGEMSVTNVAGGDGLSSSTAVSYVCPFCGLKVRFKSGLQTHILVHTGEKPFQCDVCGKRFRRQYHVKAHMVTHIGTENLS